MPSSDSVERFRALTRRLDEADHWLALLRDADIAAPPQELITECKELLAILTKSAETGRSGR